MVGINFEDWEQRKLIEIINRKNISSNSNKLPKIEFEDITAGEGRLNKDVSRKFDDRKGIIFEPNNILYGKLRPYLKNWLFPDFKGIALGDFWVFEAKDTDPKFDYYLIQAEKYQKVANDTSGTKMPRSDWKQVSMTFFSISNLEEQYQIGTFFKQLDETIALHQDKLEKLKQLKEGYLQLMFPQKEEKVPKLRLSDFSIEWEQRKLREVIESELKGKAKAEMRGDENAYLETNYLNGGNISYVNSPSDVDKDDVIILWDGSQAGTVYHGFKGALGSTLKAYKPKESGEFIYHFLKRNQQKIYNNYRTPNIPHVVKTFIDEFYVNIPIFDEQQRISTLFQQLDYTITLHQKKISTLMELKKAYLQKLFV